eukprot:362940-Chlamydomonas_euryale.AAC.7
MWAVQAAWRMRHAQWHEHNVHVGQHGAWQVTQTTGRHGVACAGTKAVCKESATGAIEKTGGRPHG